LNYCSNVCGELNKRFEYGGECYRSCPLEANYLIGNIPCLAIATINLHPKGAFLSTYHIVSRSRSSSFRVE